MEVPHGVLYPETHSNGFQKKKKIIKEYHSKHRTTIKAIKETQFIPEDESSSPCHLPTPSTITNLEQSSSPSDLQTEQLPSDSISQATLKQPASQQTTKKPSITPGRTLITSEWLQHQTQVNLEKAQTTKKKKNPYPANQPAEIPVQRLKKKLQQWKNTMFNKKFTPETQAKIQRWKDNLEKKATENQEKKNTMLTTEHNGTIFTEAQKACLKQFKGYHAKWNKRDKATTDLATAKHYRMNNTAMAIYLLIIHPRLYNKATTELKAAGKTIPSPLNAIHAKTATNPAFIPALREQLRQSTSRVELRPLGGVSCYDPPQLFFTPSGPLPSSGTLILLAPPVPQPLQPLPIQPATTPGSPMQVDPANVPLPPTTERTPDDQLWLPSDATTLYQPPLVIHMQPPEQQYHSQALEGEPISPERSMLCQSLSAMFNVPIPPHAYTRPASPMDAISESQSHCDKSRHSPSEPSISLT